MLLKWPFALLLATMALFQLLIVGKTNGATGRELRESIEAKATPKAEVLEKSLLFDCSTAQVNSPPPRLEFIHVPKTGGTYIERLAAMNGRSWGVCHYRKNIDEFACRPVTRKKRKPVFPNKWTNTSEWHTPLGIRDAWPNWAQNASLFMVVRNPYDRIVSEWNYVNEWNQNDPWKQDMLNATRLNMWVQERLKEVKSNPPVGTYSRRLSSPVAAQYYQLDSHLIPQVDYMVPGAHRLPFENLRETLQCLLHEYGLDWELPITRVNSGSGKLTASDLTQVSKDLIGEVYAADFEKFGYSR